MIEWLQLPPEHWRRMARGFFQSLGVMAKFGGQTAASGGSFAALLGGSSSSANMLTAPSADSLSALALARSPTLDGGDDASHSSASKASHNSAARAHHDFKCESSQFKAVKEARDAERAKIEAARREAEELATSSDDDDDDDDAAAGGASDSDSDA